MGMLEVGLSSIEPVAGAGFAMALAYLALDRFRYREKIEGAARHALEKYDAEGDGTPDLPPSLKGNETVNELQWLCRKDCNGFTPKGLQIWLYRAIFRRNFDVFIVVFLGAMSGLALSSGVAISIGTWGWLGCFNTPWGTFVMFYICLLSLAVPPFSVWIGRYLAKWGGVRANQLDGQIAEIMKLRAGQTQPPDLPQQ
ncbi:MAG: hypothetical protein ABL882_09120 [Sphingopyxis sp.]